MASLEACCEARLLGSPNPDSASHSAYNIAVGGRDAAVRRERRTRRSALPLSPAICTLVSGGGLLQFPGREMGPPRPRLAEVDAGRCNCGGQR